MEHMLEAHKMTAAFLQDKNLKYQRVFLARSDPATNYGLISAVLLNKIALQRLQRPGTTPRNPHPVGEDSRRRGQRRPYPPGG